MYNRYYEDYQNRRESIAFGIGSGSDLIFSLYVDDGVLSRRNRRKIVDPDIKLTGMAYCEYK